jgi:hypothetical protein
MSALETLSLVTLTAGVAAILRFMWLDSLRFRDVSADAAEATQVRPRAAQPLTLKTEGARIHSETESLPKAA